MKCTLAMPTCSEVLETVLTFHARLRVVSAILLSATLPERMKQSLLDAFARGRGCPSAPHLYRCDFHRHLWRDCAAGWMKLLLPPEMQ